MSELLPDLIQECREAEKTQALFYRALAARAEQEGEPELAQRFHDLHADEQHHLSRLTARLLELGGSPTELSATRSPAGELTGWEPIARAREEAEVERYTRLLAQPLDERTRQLVDEILDVERSHASELGGKWTMA